MNLYRCYNISKLKSKQIMYYKDKNYLPALVIDIVLWILTIYMLFFVSPESILIKTIFFTLLFLAVLITFSLLLGKTQRALVICLFLLFLFILKKTNQINPLNILILIFLVYSLKLFFKK